jgi:hypothetical protein
VAVRQASLCVWRVYQTQKEASAALEKLKINFESTANFHILTRKIKVLGQEVAVYVLLVTDRESSWLNTAKYCAMYRDIKAAKGVVRDE